MYSSMTVRTLHHTANRRGHAIAVLVGTAESSKLQTCDTNDGDDGQPARRAVVASSGSGSALVVMDKVLSPVAREEGGFTAQALFFILQSGVLFCF